MYASYPNEGYLIAGYCQQYISFERYSDYIYSYHKKDILGGSEPTKMFLVFLINPNDLTTNNKATLTIGNETIEFNTDNTQKIELIDEVLKIEKEYEKAQRLASFKYRLDIAYSNAKTISKSAKVSTYFTNLGNDFNGMNKLIKKTFSQNENWGYSIGGSGKDGGFSNNYNKSTANENLPNFDLNLIVGTYPEIKEDLNKLIENNNMLADIIVNKETSLETLKNTINEIERSYKNIMQYFKLQPVMDKSWQPNIKTAMERADCLPNVNNYVF